MIQAFLLILFHYIADFIFQDEKWAKAKSYDFNALTDHTIIYSSVMGLLTFFCLPLEFASGLHWGGFVLITFITHTITDYFTSKMVAKKFKENKLGSSIPNFGAFSIIGFDQVIHYATLFLTYNYLKA